MSQALNTARLSDGAGGRNRLHNGDFRYNKRGGGVNVNGAIQYWVDRWYSYVSGGTANVSTNGNRGAGSPNALSLIANAGATIGVLGQRIEALNIVDLVGRSVTLSGWVYHTVGGVRPTLTAFVPDATDVWTSRTTGASAYVTPANIVAGWNYFAVTFTVPATAVRGMCVEIGSPLTSGQQLALSDIKLEAGNTATAFDRQDIGDVARQCLRVFYKDRVYFPANTTVGIALPVPMRLPMSGCAISGYGAGFVNDDPNGYQQLIAHQTAPSGQTIVIDCEL
jgi:hypothetical protein